MARIGMGIVGAGFVGPHHVDAVRRLGFVDVVAVAGSNDDSGRRKASVLGARRGYGSYQALVDDPEVQVVHVATPNYLHYEVACAALAKGKHVVSDKPLATTAAEAKRLVDALERSGLVGAVTFNYRGNPLVQQARHAVAQGEIGRPTFLHGYYLQDWLLHDTDWNWRLEPDRGGALRAVGDIGSHWLDLITFVTGQHVSAVFADLTTFIGARHEPTGPVETFSTDRSAETVARPISTEDIASILLRFDGGARGSVTVSQISPGRKNSLQYEIDGSTAAWYWDSEQPDQAWIGHRDTPNEILIRNPAMLGEAGRAAAALPGGHVEGFFDTFCAHFRAVYTDVVAGAVSSGPGYPTFADGHDEMLVGDAIAASAREGRWVDVDRRSATHSIPVTTEAHG